MSIKFPWEMTWVDPIRRTQLYFENHRQLSGLSNWHRCRGNLSH